MSNERIDLTQFEGIMNIEWLFDEQLFVGEQNRWRFAINEYTDTETNTEKEYEEWENGLEPVWDSLTSAVAYLPNLLTELKRCYEELDEANQVGQSLWNALDNWDICMDDYSMHDLYEDLDEKYARDNEGRIILKELYSYTEEDGWQRKESASE